MEPGADGQPPSALFFLPGNGAGPFPLEQSHEH